MHVIPSICIFCGVGCGIGLRDQQAVAVRSRRGYLETRVHLTDDVPPGTLAMPYHFREAPCNRLTNAAQDPLSKMPELKACAVAVQALPAGSRPGMQAAEMEEGDHAGL